MSISSLVRFRQIVFLTTFLLMIAAMIGQTVWHLYKYITGIYKTTIFSEMLLNYEGGFVRRGFLGEGLFMIREIITFNVADAVLLLYYGSFFFLTWLLVRLCIKHGWSLFLLPFPVFMYLYLCDPYFMAGKRDCIILLMSYIAFLLYRRYVDNRSFVRLLIVNLWIVVALLIHEAFLFFGVIIIIFHLCSLLYRERHNLIKGIILSCIYWSPVLITLFIIYMYSGNINGVIEVISSWELYIDLGPAEQSYIYNTVGSLSLKDVVEHVFCVAWLSPIIWEIPKFPFNFVILFFLYYCLTRINTIDLKLYKLADFDHIQLSNILLLQASFLLPLSLFLFSDLARLLPYWSISSLFFFHFFEDRNEFPQGLTLISIRLQKFIDSYKYSHSQWMYWGGLLLLPIGWFGATLTGMFPFIPNELKHLMMGLEMAVNQ